MVPEDKPDSFGAEPAEPTVAEQADVTLEEAIDKALGPVDDDETPAKAAKDDAEDADEPEPDEEDELEELPDEDDDLEASADEDEGEDEEADEDEDDDMALHRAYTRLHEYGIPAKVLKRTPKDELIAWANRVVDAKAGAKDEPSKTEKKRETPDGAKEADAEPVASTWATIRSGLAEKLGIDEDSADALKPLHDTNEALQARLAALEQRLAQSDTANARREGQATIDKELRRLGTQFPDLRRNSEKQEAIVEEASTIIAGLKARKAEINVRAVFDKAARIVVGGKRADLSEKRRNGASSPPELNGLGRSAPLDEESFWNRATDLAVAGKGHQAISRLKPPPSKPGR
jgi:hypothetical protein